MILNNNRRNLSGFQMFLKNQIIENIGSFLGIVVDDPQSIKIHGLRLYQVDDFRVYIGLHKLSAPSGMRDFVSVEILDVVIKGCTISYLFCESFKTYKPMLPCLGVFVCGPIPQEVVLGTRNVEHQYT